MNLVRHSIVIVTWESQEDLERLIASMDGRLSVDTELVVVDNDSSDDPEAALTRWPGRKIFRRNSANRGFARAANTGVSMASGEVITILNPDTVLLDDSLENLTALAAASDVILGPRLLNEDGTAQPSASGPEVGAWPWIRALVPGAIQPEALLARTEPWRLYRTHQVAWLTGACLTASRKVFKQLGPFDPSLPLYGEDLDLGIRASRAGIASVFCPDLAQVVHRGGASSSRRFADEPHDLVVKNRRRVLRGAYGERRETSAWRAYRLNLLLRSRSKRTLGMDASRETGLDHAASEIENSEDAVQATSP